MSDQFIGEIRAFGFNFAPFQWAQCDGQILAISQNTALFALLGTQFGGNGTSNFGLPDMRGNAPLHQGQGIGLSQYFVGEQAGTENVTITLSTMPMHNHLVNVQETTVTAGRASVPNPSAWLGNAQPGQIYILSGSPTAQLAPSTIGQGPPNGGQPHTNQQPYLVVNFCIALAGIFPPRS
jgi:microcystin-dependent protein